MKQPNLSKPWQEAFDKKWNTDTPHGWVEWDADQCGSRDPEYIKAFITAQFKELADDLTAKKNTLGMLDGVTGKRIDRDYVFLDNVLQLLKEKYL